MEKLNDVRGKGLLAGEAFPLPDRHASVRQLAGRKAEVWGAESAADKLVMIRSE
jgi:streptogramin lyase